MTGLIESCWWMIRVSDADRHEDISRAVAFSAGGDGGGRSPDHLADYWSVSVLRNFYVKLSANVKRLIAKAKTRKAYAILGARPGPGPDLLIWPVEPMCGMWHVKGLTKAGDAFVVHFYPEQPFNNYLLAKLKREAADWALDYRVNLPYLSRSEAALEPKS